MAGRNVRKWREVLGGLAGGERLAEKKKKKKTKKKKLLKAPL